MVSATKELRTGTSRRARVRRDLDAREARRDAALAERARELRQAQIDAFFDGLVQVFALDGSARGDA